MSNLNEEVVETENMVIDVSKVLERVEEEIDKTDDPKNLDKLLTHYERLQDIRFKSATIINDIYKVDVNKEIEMARIEAQMTMKDKEIASNEKQEEAKRELQEFLANKERRANRINVSIESGAKIGLGMGTALIYLINNKLNREFIHNMNILHLNYDKTGMISSLTKENLRMAMNNLDIKMKL